jgi:hypothetical protein
MALAGGKRRRGDDTNLRGLIAALIAALLLSRRLGKLPDKRTMEMLRFHAMGMVDAESLERLLAAALRKRRA